jgi:pimeloyl-ACP methyl ester carboxylesterase
MHNVSYFNVLCLVIDAFVSSGLFLRETIGERNDQKGIAMASRSVSIEAGNVKLSGRFLPATNGEPRALLIAVHGGTYTSKYFDTSPSLLLEFCASLGYSILALDRPGYGSATSIPFDQLSFDGQVPVLRQALDEIWHDYGQQSAGMFLIGHSIGGMISLLLAAEHPHERLLGMNMTGSGALYNEQTKAAFASLVSDTPTVMMDIAIKVMAMYGPAWSYPEELAQYDPERDVPTAVIELAEAQTWGARLPQVAANVHIPVQFIVPEYDHIWRADALSHVAEMFSAAPFVDVGVQRLAGHSAELHTMARAFYMKILSFVEECIMYRQHQSSL